MEALRLAVTLVFVAVLVVLLATGNTGPLLALWLLVGVVLAGLMWAWRRSRPSSKVRF